MFSRTGDLHTHDILQDTHRKASPLTAKKWKSKGSKDKNPDLEGLNASHLRNYNMYGVHTGTTWRIRLNNHVLGGDAPLCQLTLSTCCSCCLVIVSLVVSEPTLAQILPENDQLVYSYSPMPRGEWRRSFQQRSKTRPRSALLRRAHMNSGTLKTRDWKTQDWKTREHHVYG